MPSLEVWIPAPTGHVYDPDMDVDDWEGRVVRMLDKNVGYIEQVLSVIPDGIKVRIHMDGTSLPTLSTPELKNVSLGD